MGVKGFVGNVETFAMEHQAAVDFVLIKAEVGRDEFVSAMFVLGVVVQPRLYARFSLGGKGYTQEITDQEPKVSTYGVASPGGGT